MICGPLAARIWERSSSKSRSRTPVGYQLRQAASEGLDRIDSVFSAYRQARGALLVVEPYGVPTVEQLAARYLARIGRPLMLPELTAALTSEGYPVTSAELEKATSRHPAFWGSASSRTGIGRRARSLRRTSSPSGMSRGLTGPESL